MPTYQYRCTDCDYDFDVVQKFTDDALTVCPECEGRLRKIFGNVGVVFKGSGFYATDNRNDRKAAKAASNSSSSASSPTSASGTSTSAPAPSSDSSSSSNTASSSSTTNDSGANA